MSRSRRTDGHGPTRRQFLAAGVGMAALSAFARGGPAKAFGRPGVPVAGLRGLAPAPSRAARCIFIFLGGGASHVDLFDPKPALVRFDGRSLPDSFAKSLPPDFAREESAVLRASPFPFRRYGRCGTEMSSLLPQIGSHADEIALIRSVRTTAFNHHPAQLLMSTGYPRFGATSVGTRLARASGGGSDEVPDHVSLAADYPRAGGAGASAWSGGAPSAGGAGMTSLLLRAAGEGGPEDPRTLDAYGVARPVPRDAHFARNCVLARRLIEAGARCVTFHDPGWDHHVDLRADLGASCRAVDRPIGALLDDLNQRGLLDTTLVVCATEFGRSPLGERSRDGRDHHPYAFSVWIAGAGVKGGQVLGRTDDFGWNVVDNPVEVSDLHAIILHLAGAGKQFAAGGQIALGELGSAVGGMFSLSA